MRIPAGNQGRVALSGVILTALCACALPVFSADWKPERRVEIVVPNAPGGGNDRIVRLMQKIMQDNRLVDVVTTVVNKPGAGIVMGLNYLNQHAGDGHYIAIASTTFLGDYVSGRSTIGLSDVVPIAQLFTEYVAFAVKADSKIGTGRDLVALLKADAGSVSTAISGGIGNHNYVALALVARAAGGDLRKLKVAVFNSGSEAMTALLGGHVDLLITPAASALPQVNAGRIRMIAITSPKRLLGAFADVPVWKELGVNAVVSNWRAMMGPRGMTPPQVAFWENTFARVAEADDWKTMLERDVLTNEFMRSGETRNQLKSQYDELKSVMTELGLTKQQ